MSAIHMHSYEIMTSEGGSGQFIKVVADSSSEFRVLDNDGTMLRQFEKIGEALDWANDYAKRYFL